MPIRSLVLALSLIVPSATPRMVASLSNAPQSQSESEGNIGGVVTFYFNANFGDRPDVGAKVFLLTGSIDVPPNVTTLPGKSTMILFPFRSPGAKPQEVPILDRTVVDGAGRFSLEHVKPGSYTVIIQSKHSTGKDPRDSLGRVKCIEVEVTAGHGSDASVSFSATYL